MIKRCLLLLLLLLTSIPVKAAQADPVTVHLLLKTVTDLDPVSIPRNDDAGRDLVENLFVGLTRYDPATATIQKALATDWKVSPDGLTWDFTLRNDVQWVTFDTTSGKVVAVRPVVAGDFVYGIRRACSPTPPNPAAHTIFIIDGCRTIATASPGVMNDIFMARELHVATVNDTTLEIKLLFPAPYFIALTALPEFRPVPREAITKDAANLPKFTATIADGPYVIAAQGTGTLSLVRNPLWPLTPTGNIERIEVTFSDTPTFNPNSTDFVRLDPATTGSLKPENLLIGPGVDSKITVLGFSTELPGVFNEAFRRALAAAIDRDALVKSVYPGAALPMSGLIPPGAVDGPAAIPDNSSFSADVAKVSMSASGFGACNPPEKLLFAVEDTPQTLAVANALIADWGTVVGCPITKFSIQKGPLSLVQNAAHANIATNDSTGIGRPHLWLFSWQADYDDANGWIGDGIHCIYGYMRTGLACSAVEKLIDSAALEPDPAKRAASYAQAQSILFGPGGKFPVAPLYISLTAIGHSARLSGIALNGAARFDTWTLK